MYIYIYIHIYTYILHCSQKILESYDMMPELSQRRPAAKTTIATDEAGDQAAEDREDEDKDEHDEKQLSSQHRIISHSELQ